MVGTLRDVWRVHYARGEDGRPRWRAGAELPPVGERLQSPYDPEAHYSTKRQMEWSGYKVHTIRTQSTVRLRRPPALRWGAVQRDDMPDLQAAFVNDDALDHEPLDRLPVGERGPVEPAAHPFAERGHVGHDLLRLGAPVA